MSSFSDYTENAVLNHLFRNTALPVVSTLRVGLYTAAPTDAGGGTEVSGGGYARAAVTFGAPSGGAIANTAAVTFTAAGAAFGTIVAVGYFDAATAGNLIAYAPVTSAVIGDGDSITFPIGQLTVSLT